MYSPAQIIELDKDHFRVNADLVKLYSLIPMIATHLSSEAREHALYGVGRRLGLIRECLCTFFDLLPPNIDSEPENETRIKANVHLHAFLINICGVIDNMAWIWAYQAGVNLTIDLEEKKRSIGLFNRSFYNHLSSALQAKVKEYEPWHDFVTKHRHPTAHRIPPYIIPYTNPEENDPSERRDYTPRYIHSFSSEHGPVYLHPQSLSDTKTIISLLDTLFAELLPGKWGQIFTIDNSA